MRVSLEVLLKEVTIKKEQGVIQFGEYTAQKEDECLHIYHSDQGWQSIEDPLIHALVDRILELEKESS